MKKLRFLPILLISFCLSAQDKGVRPLSAPARQVSAGGEASATTVTRAVVVGISNYLNIPDLKYANRDAEAFAGWLRSEAGGNVPEQQIELLLDTAATMGRVAMALDWLMTESQEGDRAIIYFSGHGDVEKKMFGQPGYLLCCDAPKAVYMSGGTLSVSALQDVVATLTVERKAQVVMITDACRAGALAGSTIGGPQLTTAALQERFANAVRIMSCQPNEYSLESRQWGGGRGVFSYHLVEGLYGLADQDGDLLVKLKEIGRYLEDRVPVETDPQMQNPVVLGDREMQLAVVSAPLLAARKAMRDKEQPGFYSGDMRSMAGLIPVQADSLVQEVYRDFLAAVSAGWLMKAPTNKRSANECYDILIRDSSIAELHGFIKRHFVAALVDESQVVTNKLLVTDPNIVSDVISRPFVFDHIHTYLARAIELLGERHFLYKQLKAKQCYFEAKTYRKENYPDVHTDSLSNIYLQKMEAALRFDSMAAYAILDLGMYYSFTEFNWDKATEYCRRALDLAPNWVIAYYTLGTSLVFSFEPSAIKEGLAYLERALALDTTFYPTYIPLGIAYADIDANKYLYYLGEYTNQIQAQIRSNPDSVPVFYYNQLGNALWKLAKPTEAEKALLAAEAMSKGQSQNTYINLIGVYSMKEQWEKVIKVCNKALEFSPMNWEVYTQLGSAYLKNGQATKAEAVYKQMASLSINAPSKYLAYRCLGDLYLTQGRSSEAESMFQSILKENPNPLDAFTLNAVGRAEYVLNGKAAMEAKIRPFMDKNPEDLMAIAQIACIYALAGDEKEAFAWLEKGLGYSRIASWLIDPDFLSIRHTPAAEAHLKKYFPEGIK